MATSNELEALARAVEDLRARNQDSEADIRELRALLAQLVDILAGRGDLNKGHQRLLGKIAERARAPRKPEVKLALATDKYAAVSPDIDCASLLHLCQARCCSFKVRLSKSDVRSGALEWDIREPYVLSRGPDGYCAYIDRGSGGCTCYAERPAICRTYDCRKDERVWLDFDQRIPAPHSLPPLVRSRGDEEG
jgi:Fe-S-cluster containining protein